MADIIHIGDWQIHRKGKQWHGKTGECDHKHIELDSNGDIVLCSRCGIQLSAFWVLEMLSEEYNRAFDKLKLGRDALAKAKESETHLLAARKVESVWRSRTMIPACPHCGSGIFPEDNLGSCRINREIELRRRTALRKATENRKET